MLHPLEPQRRAPPLVAATATLWLERRGPVEPVEDRRKPPFARQISEILHLDDGILHVRRDDAEILGIHRDQLEVGHIGQVSGAQAPGGDRWGGRQKSTPAQ